MGKLVSKVFLDSDVLIEILKNNDEVIRKLNLLDSEIYSGSINSFELWTGRRKSEKENLRKFLESIKILDFDYGASLTSGEIRKKLEGSGNTIDFRDIFIASICISNKIQLFTLNKKHFNRMVKFGLELID